MSRGPGNIERRIADLFAATRHHALDVETIARHAFKVLAELQPTRAQRLSATRAAHRVLQRQRKMEARADQLDPESKEAIALREERWRIGIWVRILPGERRGTLRGESEYWRAITLNGRLRFYPGDVPAQVWAVTIDRSGIHWFDADITRITELNVMVRYRGQLARLDRRRLFHGSAWWRGVRFVSFRDGRIAARLEEQWHRRYGTTGSVPPAMQMPLADAQALLDVPDGYTKDDVLAAFRHAAKKAHPDVGGTAEMFRLLVEARDRLLTALGTSAPPPKPPDYAPQGVRTIYRRVKSGADRRLSAGGYPRLDAK